MVQDVLNKQTKNRKEGILKVKLFDHARKPGHTSKQFTEYSLYFSCNRQATSGLSQSAFEMQCPQEINVGYVLYHPSMAIDNEETMPGNFFCSSIKSVNN